MPAKYRENQWARRLQSCGGTMTRLPHPRRVPRRPNAIPSSLPAPVGFSLNRLAPALLAALLGVALAGCGTDLVANEGFEINCDGEPCDWTVVEGEPTFAGAWHPADPGIDLSGSGRIVVEQRAAPFSLDQRELLLSAAMARTAEVDLRFEFDWYVEGSADGAGYWAREPLLVTSRGFNVDRTGVLHFQELISTPSLEVSGVVIRIVKDGTGTAVLDEIHLDSMGDEL